MYYIQNITNKTLNKIKLLTDELKLDFFKDTVEMKNNEDAQSIVVVLRCHTNSKKNNYELRTYELVSSDYYDELNDEEKNVDDIKLADGSYATLLSKRLL